MLSILKHLGLRQRHLSSSTLTKCLLLLVIVCILLYLGWNVNRKYGVGMIGLPVKNKNKEMEISQVSNIGHGKEKLQPNVMKDSINVLITLTNTKTIPDLIPRFQTTVSTMLKHCTVPLNIYIIGDKASHIVAENILKGEVHKVHIQIHKVNIDDVLRDLNSTVKEVQKYFGYHSYFAQSLFFLSIGIHQVKAFDFDKAILIDSDLKFESDIKDLYKHFDNFAENNVMGLAPENQPVYRHFFSSYRRQNPGTRVGGPPPNGLPGLNSGVILLDMKRMQGSAQYNKLISSEVLQRMTKTYDFKGHLGDQDFFTLMSLEYEDLFYVLPCTWNRQLCLWWRGKGYDDVFDLYFKCNGKINIYHGNCKSKFPDSDHIQEKKKRN